ncbi:unnamed protein product [Brachionus calyciflorus]|uniref:Uncharacterized protein n=1 Tax=Brachionus calyciflorus TaxID=104777 RepID=A0A813RR38_9BILA|nr:unnamed protein product [Brachionus calyciflorus]
MMKLTVALLVVLVGLTVAVEEFKWDSVPSAGNNSQCVYRPQSRVLGCRGSDNVVECETVGQLPQGFEVFGLGRESLEGVVSVESQRYWFYPRELNQTVYHNHTVQGQNTTEELSLFHLERNQTVGLRVPDVKCWTRLVELFNASVGVHVVPVLNSTTEVPLFGEVLILERQAQKRWLGLGLLGLGLNPLLFGWGGLWGVAPLFPLLG